MLTVQIYFKEGLVVRLPINKQMLVSMLELRPGLTGVSFRKNLKFSVVLKDGRRTVMSTSRINLIEDEQQANRKKGDDTSLGSVR